jgi:hypothetical protein
MNTSKTCFLGRNRALLSIVSIFVFAAGSHKLGAAVAADEVTLVWFQHVGSREDSPLFPMVIARNNLSEAEVLHSLGNIQSAPPSVVLLPENEMMQVVQNVSKALALAPAFVSSSNQPTPFGTFLVGVMDKGNITKKVITPTGARDVVKSIPIGVFEKNPRLSSWARVLSDRLEVIARDAKITTGQTNSTPLK